MSEHICKNNRGKHGCQNIVTDDGEDESGYCEVCYYPGVVEANEQYEAFLAQGYSRTQAADLAGLNDRIPVIKYGTVPITNVNQDGDEDGDDAVDEQKTDQILSRIEDENNEPELPD